MNTANSTIVEGAVQLIEAGYHVFPLNNKAPANEHAAYGNTNIPEVVRENARSYKAVAIATGATSGVAVIDADGPTVFQYMYERFGEPHVRTKRGGHWYFRTGGDKIKNGPLTHVMKGLGVSEDLHCKGDNLYVAAPPSPGKEWIDGIPDRTKLPVLPKDLHPPKRRGSESANGRPLKQEQRNEAVETIGRYVSSMGQGERHASLLPLAGSLLSQGYNTDTTAEIIEDGWRDTGDTELERRVDKGEVARGVADTAEKMEGGEHWTGRPSLDAEYPGFSDELSDALGWVIKPTHHDTHDTFSESYELTEFPTSAFPNPLADYIEAAADSLNAPPELVAIPALGALSGVIGRSKELAIKRRYRIPALLWLVVIAGAGEKKSPAQDIATLPLREIQMELRDQYAADKESWGLEMRQHALDSKLARKNDKVEPKAPEKPTLQRVLVDDITIEALALRLAENPRGFLSAQDELAGFMRGLDQYKAGGKGNSRQQYLKIWSCGAIQVDRKTDDEPIFIPKPFVALQGGMQPSIIHEIAAGRDDGFMDRFLFSYPDTHAGGLSDYEIPESVEEAYSDLIYELWGDGDPATRVIGMASDAKAQFKRASLELAQERKTPGFPRVLDGAWGKMESQLARLALILSCVRQAVKGGPDAVTAEDVDNALALLDYFKGAARKVWGQIYEADPVEVLAGQLVTLLTRSGYKASWNISNLYYELYHTQASRGDATSLGMTIRRVVERYPRAFSLSEKRTGDERIISLTYKKVSQVSLEEQEWIRI